MKSQFAPDGQNIPEKPDLGALIETLYAFIGGNLFLKFFPQ